MGRTREPTGSRTGAAPVPQHGGQAEAPTIHNQDQQPEPEPAPAIQAQEEDQAEARNLASASSSQRQQQPEPERRHIGTCLVEEYGTGKPCGSTHWWPSREEEYVCAKCLSPIAWTRRIEEQRAK
jgi:hypothetical protein